MKLLSYALFLNLIVNTFGLAAEFESEAIDQYPYCGYISIDFDENEGDGEVYHILSGSCAAVETIQSDKGTQIILLSAAHNFLPSIMGASMIGTVNFSADPLGTKSFNIETLYFLKAYQKEDALDATDICLAVTTALSTDERIRTVDILEDKITVGELFEATIVGYGNMYGPQVTEEVESVYKRRSCKTYLSLKNYEKNDSAYETQLKSSVTFKTFMSNLETNIESFEDTSGRDIKVRSGWVKCHCEQMIPSSGCSGGPVIIEKMGKPRILGVYSKNDISNADEAEGMPIVSLSVTPIQPNPWILSVISNLKEDGVFEGNDEISKASMKITS